MNIEEEAFVQAFIQPDRQERFLAFLSDPKKRVKFISEFDHLKSRFLDVRFATVLTGSSCLPPNVYATLRKHGAPKKCCAIGGGYDG